MSLLFYILCPGVKLGDSHCQTFLQDCWVWREGADLTFHLVGITAVSSEHVDYFVSFQSDMDRGG